MKSILEEREKENLYCVSLHSGTQMTLQFAIGFQLGTVYTYNILGQCPFSAGQYL